MKKISGLLLHLLSKVLKFILGFVLWPYGIVRSLFKKEFNAWQLKLAIAEDQYGNGLGQYMFNDLLITKDSKHKFGNIDETISSVLGKNKKAGTLTRLGKIISWILDRMDPNHVEKSIDETE
jgi:8-oxo-dGTP diphosphatase